MEGVANCVSAMGDEMDSQQRLNSAVMYALREGCFFPVPEPKAGATIQELIQWGAMRNLHDAIAEFNKGIPSKPEGTI